MPTLLCHSEREFWELCWNSQECALFGWSISHPELAQDHLKTVACSRLCTYRKVNFHESENGDKVSKMQFWKLKSFGESSEICCFVALLSTAAQRYKLHYSTLRPCPDGAVPLPKHKYLMHFNKQLKFWFMLCPVQIATVPVPLCSCSSVSDKVCWSCGWTEAVS